MYVLSNNVQVVVVTLFARNIFRLIEVGLAIFGNTHANTKWNKIAATEKKSAEILLNVHICINTRTNNTIHAHSDWLMPACHWYVTCMSWCDVWRELASSLRYTHDERNRAREPTHHQNIVYAMNKIKKTKRETNQSARTTHNNLNG